MFAIATAIGEQALFTYKVLKFDENTSKST